MATSTAVHHAFRAGAGLTDEARAVLGRRLYAVLGTENDDGSPHLVPVMFLFDGEHIRIETGAGTRKARNVAARGRASVLVQTPEASWVCGSGAARLVRGAEAIRLSAPIKDKYLTAAGHEACDALFTELDDTTIVVTPDRWLHWDMTGLMEALAARGADLDAADTWFAQDG